MNIEDYKIIDIYPGTDENVTHQQRVEHVKEVIEMINNGDFELVDID